MSYKAPEQDPALVWREGEREEARQLRLKIEEAAAYYRGSVSFDEIVERSEMNPEQRLYWISLATKDYLERLERVVGWLATYRWAAAREDAARRWPGVDWDMIPLHTRRAVHESITERLGLPAEEIDREISQWPQVLQSNFHAEEASTQETREALERVIYKMLENLHGLCYDAGVPIIAAFEPGRPLPELNRLKLVWHKPEGASERFNELVAHVKSESEKE